MTSTVYVKGVNQDGSTVENIPVVTVNPFPMAHVSAQYYGPVGLILATDSAGQGDMRLCPFWVPVAGYYDRIVAEITTIGEANCVVRLGAYSSDPVTCKPALASPLFDAGTVPGDTTGAKEITINQFLPQGLVWLAAVSQLCPTTAPVKRGHSVASGIYPAAGGSLGSITGSAGSWQQTGVTGALSAWVQTAATGATTCPKVWLRKA